MGDGGKIVAKGGESVRAKDKRKWRECEEEKDRKNEKERERESDFPWYSNRLDTWNWPKKGKYYMSKKERIQRWVKIEKSKGNGQLIVDLQNWRKSWKFISF